MVTGIIGMGLMGGSFGRTLMRLGLPVYGSDISENALIKAEAAGAMAERLTKENAGELDLLVTAVNPSDFPAAAEEFMPHLKSGAAVIDFSGTKRGVIRAMRDMAERYPELCFIGGHPMAGREFSGIEHSVSHLFDRASMIFVPVKADIFELDRFKKFFLSLGFGEVVITTAENHDRMIAFTSQMCHAVSNAYILSPTAKEHFGYSAGSYKDMTRVARLNSRMWSELMVENGDYLSRELGIFIDNLKKYKAAIDRGDKEELRGLLEKGNRIKIETDGGAKDVKR